MYYTKYRPQKFSDVSQPNDTAMALMNQLKKNNTVHAYLFVGPRGTGKTTTARILAKALNCKKLNEDGDPCLKCESCNSIALGTYIDLIEIDAASNRGIDDIRDLRDKIKLSPSAGDKKIYIIDEVHMLTSEAFNALLKTLEEPPQHAVFILCTTEFHKVPDTIKSRCQVFKFKRATKAQLVKRLEDICKFEKVKNLKKEDLSRIADASFGGFRDAETLLQQIVEGNLDASTFVGGNLYQSHIDFINFLMNSDTKEALHSISKLVEEGIDLHVWSLGLLSYLRDLLFIKASADTDVVDVSVEIRVAMELQAQSLSYEKLVLFITTFMESSNKINDAVLAQLPIELGIITICEDIDPLANNNGSKGDPDPLPILPISKPIKASKGKTNDNDLEDFGNDFFDEEDIEPDDSEDDVEIEENISPVVEFTLIEDQWAKIVKEVIQFNTSIHTLLKSSTPLSIEGNRLILEVSYKFHKERLESPKNRKIVETIIWENVGQKLSITCIVNATKRKPVKKGETGELTDQNITAAVFTGQDMPENIADIFDGALPI